MSKNFRPHKQIKPIYAMNFPCVPNHSKVIKPKDSSIKAEDIVFTVPQTNKRNEFSYKDIKITYHAKNRAYTRLGISSEIEIQKLSASAKKNGLNLNALNMMNYDSFGLSFKHYQWLKSIDYYCLKSEVVYFYKGMFFVFTGNKNRTLKTIITINTNNKEEV